MLLQKAGQPLLGAVSFRRLSEQTRSIHIPRRIISPSSPINLVHRTRTLLTQLVGQIHGRGLQVARFTHPTPSIRQSLSFPARIALSRPLGAPCLPRAPRVPGNVTQVGLGTARNFSTGRPMFQNIVQNVPVAGRAFYEVDWDLNLRKEKNSRVRRPKKADHKAKLADKLTPLPEHVSAPVPVTVEEEIQHYFHIPSTSHVTTYLQIPLAPTPTSRVPLTPSSSSPPLLPLPRLAKEHASHSKHAIGVSSLFRRLDAARVWERGVTCETFGDPSGLCTILRVKFDGWSEDMVKDVLGDAGKGWCTIQELRPAPEVHPGAQESQLLSLTTQTAPTNEMTYVMPVLDFSASFATASSPPTSWSSMLSSPKSFSDAGSDCSYSLTPESAPIAITNSSPSLWSSMPSSPQMFSDAWSDYSFPSIQESSWDEDSDRDVMDEWSRIPRNSNSVLTPR